MIAKCVADLSVEHVHGVNCVCFVFPAEPEADQDGLQFQWADDDANAKGLYVEIGGQGTGSYVSVSAVSLQESAVVVTLASSTRLPHSIVQLDCARIAPELLAEAVAKLNAVLAH